MGKPDGHPINKSSGSIGQRSQASNGDDMCDLSLNLAVNSQVAQENKDLAKKGKSIKVHIFLISFHIVCLNFFST